MTPVAKKKKPAVTASVQAVSEILKITPDAVIGLITHGQLKARRNRNRLQVDVMCPSDEYAINYDSVLEYSRKLAPAQGEAKVSTAR